MNRLTEYLIALCDYLACEAQAARKAVVHLAIALAVVVLAAIFALAALAFLHWAAYLQMLSLESTRSAAALVVGLMGMITAGGLVWLAKFLAR